MTCFHLRFLGSLVALASLAALLTCCATAAEPVTGTDPPLPGTQPLQAEAPLDVLMVQGIDRFSLREIQRSAVERDQLWNRNYSSVDEYVASIQPHRDRFRRIIGAVDPREPARGWEFISTTTQDALVTENSRFSIYAVRWPVLKGVTAEGLFLKPTGKPVARVIALPDADWTPEMIAGLADCDSQFAAQLACAGLRSLGPHADQPRCKVQPQ